MNPDVPEIWKSTEVAQRFLTGRAAHLPLASNQAEVLLRLLGALDRPVRRLADVGCGGGRVGLAVLEAFPQARAVFSDYNQTMLEACRDALAGREEQAVVLHADFADENWKDLHAPHGPYDAIVSGFAIHHQPHSRKRSLYADIFELLAEGGIFVNIEHVASASAWIERIHDRYFVEHVHQAGGFEGRNLDEALAEYRRRPDRQANVLAPVSEQLGWLERIGYTDVDCFFKCFELSVFGGRKPA
jgi:ubiquinone/menaquinone biosynthesis C-methylase UbiE